MDWTHLDKQMRAWSPRLRDELKIESAASNRLATTIAKEVSALPKDVKTRAKHDSKIPLSMRKEELMAFQGFDELTIGVEQNPIVCRARIVNQLYFSFIYIRESYFNLLKNELAVDSATRKCSAFLTANPVQAFRKAIAQGEWRYTGDFSGLEYWARDDAEPAGSLVRFQVSNQDYNFWMILARCTTYASFMCL
jgi:hypothetical protein